MATQNTIERFLPDLSGPSHTSTILDPATPTPMATPITPTTTTTTTGTTTTTTATTRNNPTENDPDPSSAEFELSFLLIAIAAFVLLILAVLATLIAIRCWRVRRRNRSLKHDREANLDTVVVPSSPLHSQIQISSSYKLQVGTDSHVSTDSTSQYGISSPQNQQHIEDAHYSYIDDTRQFCDSFTDSVSEYDISSPKSKLDEQNTNYSCIDDPNPQYANTRQFSNSYETFEEQNMTDSHILTDSTSKHDISNPKCNSNEQDTNYSYIDERSPHWAKTRQPRSSDDSTDINLKSNYAYTTAVNLSMNYAYGVSERKAKPKFKYGMKVNPAYATSNSSED